MLRDEKILITGVTGKSVIPIAASLARDNEVWGAARFTDPALRRQVEALGVRTVQVDLASGQFDDVPADFTRLMHFAWMRAPLAQLEEAIQVNVEGAGLMLQHCRKARSALVVSSQGIYTPNEDPFHPYTETDPIGRGATAYAATSPATKLGVEAVARFCARAFNLPTTIARLNTVVGVPGAYYSAMLARGLAGEDVITPHDPNPHAPIHTLDMQAHVHSLSEAAGVPALLTNWGGDETIVTQQAMARASELTGVPISVKVVTVPGAPKGNNNDSTRRRSVTGPCQVSFWPAFDGLVREAEAARAKEQGA